MFYMREKTVAVLVVFFLKREIKSFFFFLPHLAKQKNSPIFPSSCLSLQISQVFFSSYVFGYRRTVPAHLLHLFKKLHECWW